jgi:hypothetical protein
MKITQKMPFLGLLNPLKKSPWAFKKSPIGKKLPNLATLFLGFNIIEIIVKCKIMT